MGAHNPDVDAWIERYENPMKPLLERTRGIILGSDDRVDEVIKWSTPTFVYKGNLASFQPRAKQFVSILFHEGASIPGVHPLLEGGGEHARYARITDDADLDARRPELEAVVRAWCDSREGR